MYNQLNGSINIQDTANKVRGLIHELKQQKNVLNSAGESVSNVNQRRSMINSHYNNSILQYHPFINQNIKNNLESASQGMINASNKISEITASLETHRRKLCNAIEIQEAMITVAREERKNLKLRSAQMPIAKAEKDVKEYIQRCRKIMREIDDAIDFAKKRNTGPSFNSNSIDNVVGRPSSSLPKGNGSGSDYTIDLALAAVQNNYGSSIYDNQPEYKTPYFSDKKNDRTEGIVEKIVGNEYVVPIKLRNNYK